MAPTVDKSPLKSSDNGKIKKKRSKSFTGCFTCRSRKIGCDLGRPFCQKCIKSKIQCSGYDVKLTWLKPLEFDSYTGTAPLGAFQSQEDEESKDKHRRTMNLVHWENEKNHRPYYYYEDMDKDLGILHNLVGDLMILKNTKMLGPFGVFGSSQSAISHSTYIAEAASSPDTSLVSPAKVEGSTPNTAMYTQLNPKLGGLQVGASPASTAANLGIVSASPAGSTGAKLHTSNVSKTANMVTSQDQLWLSNELRDDALLTAAALNGDTQYLDVMSTFSTTPNGSMLTPIYYSNATQGYNTNQNEFLNLVFHRHSGAQVAPETIQDQHLELNQLHINGNEPNIQDLLNHPYSSYNDHYYNNPFKQNENLEIHLDASTTQPGTDIVEGEQNNATTMPHSIMCVLELRLQPKLGFDITIPLTADVKNPPDIPSSALQVQPLTRYLINHYITHVADLMTVIPLTDNPWKTIYFPRALSAVGELAALGKTSDAKNALLNALLAVLAFNLQLKFPKNSKPMKYYLHLGIRLRNQSSLFVKKLLSHSTDEQSGIEHCVRHEKYKDVLCAVMSMISVDLVWGTMQDTHFYITWCGKVIAQKMKTKRKLSSKARILHRIFASMKLIQDLTCLDVNIIKGENRVGYDVNGDKFANDSIQTKNKIDFIVNSSEAQPEQPQITKSPDFHDNKLINTKKDDANFATDALYGLPNSLILLFSETVSLVRTKLYHQETYQTIPEAFELEVEMLGKKLKQWKLDWILYEGQESRSEENMMPEESKKFLSLMHEATYHHIMSFYYALYIYFHKLVEDKPVDEVQDLVGKTLMHLNSIQVLIGQDKAAIIPLFWQGFIAGCEAISEELQQGFKKWGADIAQYLGSYWGARQIMLEVWRRKRMHEERDDWVCVIQDWEMNLMLN